ncbi:hypothetical protein [Paracidovorax cattleyae]|uniref:hypothetical protein n=1 Tax=Paracidovorax cattleyae TaxID=80868 RepID=UPI0018AFFDEF|nr:hypothetical protein [Paracidovorax cattleyae]MBF9264055.1 hypothetical protein [Paracidovorax cattleyae]
MQNISAPSTPSARIEPSMDGAVKVKIQEHRRLRASIGVSVGTTFLPDTRPPRKLPTITETP